MAVQKPSFTWVPKHFEVIVKAAGRSASLMIGKIVMDGGFG